MKTISQTNSPTYIQNYDATYEYHECHYISTDSEETFEHFYTRQLTLAKDDPLKTHLLRQCYYKVLAYKIEYSGMNQERTDYQLILLLQHLLASYRSHLHI